MLEHIYTASPRGLDPNRSGFVTVAYTNGFPPNLISPLENLSGYKALYAPGDPKVEANPANYSFQHYGKDIGTWYVVSRITYAGPSYTGRSNNLAHHLIFSREELEAMPGGAAAVLADERNWIPYSGTPGLLPPRRCHCEVPVSGREGVTWARLCGSADWAHVVAERFREDRTKGVVLQFTPEVHSVRDILALVSEVVTWLTAEEAADFTFSTYCYQSAIGNPVFFRAYTADSPYLASVRRLNPQGVIVLGDENPFGADEERLLHIYRERVRREQDRAQERQAMAERGEMTKKPEAPQSEKAWGGAPMIVSNPAAASLGATGGRVLRKPTDPREIFPVRKEEPPRSLSRFVVVVALVVVLASIGFGAVFFWPQLSAHFTGPGEDGNSTSALSQEDPAQVAVEAETHDLAESPVVENPLVSVEVAPPQSADEMGENLQFFEDFLLSRKSTIPLPTRFAAAGVVSVELSGIGEKDKDSISGEAGALSQSAESRCVVYPLEWTDDATRLNRILVVSKDQAKNQLVLEIADGNLRIQEPTVGEMLPSRDNITRILIGEAILFSREFTEMMKDRLWETETVSGSVELTQDGWLIGRASCSERLLKYREFLRLEAKLIGNGKQISRSTSVELSNSNRDFKILNLEEALELNRGCHKLSELKKALSGLHDEYANYFQIVNGDTQNLNREIQNVNGLSQFIKNKEITIRESKKKPQKVKINAEDSMAQICRALGELQNHFILLSKRDNQVSQALFAREVGDMNYALQYLSAVLQDLRNPALMNWDGYAQDRQNIQTVINEVNAIVKMAQERLTFRVELEANLNEKEKEIQSTQEEISRARAALVTKLQGILSPESYGKNFKTILEGDGYSPIDLEMLRGELQKECSLEFRLELR